MPLIPIGRTFFALALLGLGTEHFIYGEFVTGRAPAWPDGVPGKLVWVYGSGVLVMLTGVAILARRWGRPAALALGILLFTWALLRHLPVIAADSLLAGSWTRAGKALTLFGASFAVAATLPAPSGTPTKGWHRFVNSTGPLVRLGQLSLAAFLILTGLQHFKFLEFVAALVPAWIPGDAFWWSRFAGVALIAGGVGLLFRRTEALAALATGLMVFSWFWIVHLPRVHMSVSDGIALFEALAVSGIALLVAGVRRRERTDASALSVETNAVPFGVLEVGEETAPATDRRLWD